MAEQRGVLNTARFNHWTKVPGRTPPSRLGTGRRKDASKAKVEKLIQFLKRYGIPLRAFTRFTHISPWALRQARACVRPLSIRQEMSIDKTLKQLQGGQIWLRRVTR